MKVVSHTASTQNFYLNHYGGVYFSGLQIYISGTDVMFMEILEKEVKIELLQSKVKRKSRKSG
jgi:hypothetical protein